MPLGERWAHIILRAGQERCEQQRTQAERDEHELTGAQVTPLDHHSERQRAPAVAAFRIPLVRARILPTAATPKQAGHSATPATPAAPVA
jgi:hypothetical protein